MIPHDRLDQIRSRFEFLEAKLNAGAAVADLPPSRASMPS